MTDRPTRGAGTAVEPQSWTARPLVSRVVRLFVVLAPAAASLVVTWTASPRFFRPDGWLGVAIWIVQLGVVGVATALVVERLSRRVLPLANLLGMSLVFPDNAPSRFSVALRSGTTKQLEREVDHLRRHGISSDATEAAEQLLVLVSALGRHEKLTRGHTERVRAYSELIGEEMGLSRHDQSSLRWGALIHDIGKLAIPAPILSKEERLEDVEWQTIKLHPEVGAALVQPLEEWLGEWRLAASEHHERWDGAGYPYGLAGTDISLAGRIVAVADTYDVITSTRSYKKASTAEEARKELVRCSGSQFDPAVVRAFLNVSVGNLHPIAGRFAWLANLSLLFQQAPAAVQGALVGGAAVAAVAGGVATGALDVAPIDDRPEAGTAAARRVEAAQPDPRFTFPSLPDQAGVDVPSPTSPPVAGNPSFPPAPPSPAGSTSPGPDPSTPATIATGPAGSSTTLVTPPATSTSTTVVPPTTTVVAPTTTADPGVGSDCAAAQGGETNLSGADLHDCDLSGADLDLARLDGANLSGADLTGASVTEAVLANADLTGASFAGADLSGSRLSSADAVGTDFTDAQLWFVTLGGTDLAGADMTRANLTWAVGNPRNTDTATWLDTTCPSGVVQSSDCFG